MDAVSLADIHHTTLPLDFWINLTSLPLSPSLAYHESPLPGSAIKDASSSMSSSSPINSVGADIIEISVLRTIGLV